MIIHSDTDCWLFTSKWADEHDVYLLCYRPYNQYPNNLVSIWSFYMSNCSMSWPLNKGHIIDFKQKGSKVKTVDLANCFRSQGATGRDGSISIDSIAHLCMIWETSMPDSAVPDTLKERVLVQTESVLNSECFVIIRTCSLHKSCLFFTGQNNFVQLQKT